MGMLLAVLFMKLFQPSYPGQGQALPVHGASIVDISALRYVLSALDEALVCFPVHTLLVNIVIQQRQFCNETVPWLAL